MRLPLNRTPFPYEDTRTWNALRDALRELDRKDAVHLCSSESLVLSVLCAALDRAGVFSLGESPRTSVGR